MLSIILFCNQTIIVVGNTTILSTLFLKDGLLSSSDLVAAFGAYGKNIGGGEAQVLSHDDDDDDDGGAQVLSHLFITTKPLAVLMKMFTFLVAFSLAN